MTSGQPWSSEEQPLVYNVSPQHSDPIKSGTIAIVSSHWDSLSLDRRKSTRDTRWKFCSWLFSLDWFVLPKKRKLSKVSQRYQWWFDLGGGLGCVWVCVHFVVLLCRSINSLCPSNSALLHLLALHHILSYFVSISSLLCINWLMHFSCSCHRERINPPAVGDLAFDVRAQARSEMSPFLLSVWFQFLHYFINPVLFSEVWKCVLICTRDGKQVV